MISLFKLSHAMRSQHLLYLKLKRQQVPMRNNLRGHKTTRWLIFLVKNSDTFQQTLLLTTLK